MSSLSLSCELLLTLLYPMEGFLPCKVVWRAFAYSVLGSMRLCGDDEAEEAWYLPV